MNRNRNIYHYGLILSATIYGLAYTALGGNHDVPQQRQRASAEHRKESNDNSGAFRFVSDQTPERAQTVGYCFYFTAAKPQDIGPVRLFAPAEQVCVNWVRRIGGSKFYSISFYDRRPELGALAEISSQTENLGKCGPTELCKAYSLTSGNSNGQNVEVGDTPFNFHVDTTTNTGTVTIGGQSYSVKRLVPKKRGL